MGFPTGGSAHAGDMSLLLDGGATRVGKRVKSLLDLRRERVILQNLDFSCGAAALATVLRHGFGIDTSERELISLIFVFGQTPKAGVKKYFKRKGFTLLDLKRAARAKGFKSVGYKGMNINELAEILDVEKLPVLVPIRPMDYNHFVIVKGFRGKRIYLADPAFGNKSMTISQFLDVWIDGIGFIVKPRPSIAQANTNHAHAIKNDEELSMVTAGGAVSTVSGSETAPSKNLLELDQTSNSVDYWRIQNFLYSSLPHQSPNLVPTFQNPDGLNLISTFNVQGFSGALQLGEPGGNFVDFSPPPGQSINSGN